MRSSGRNTPTQDFICGLLAQGAPIFKSPTGGGCKLPFLEAQGLRLSADDLFI
jgi:hypothetical protein